MTICPLEPQVPAFEVNSTTSPLLKLLLTPETANILPPLAGAIIDEVEPDDNIISPPAPESPLPTVTYMEPPFPDSAVPVPIKMAPLLPTLDVPVLSTRYPLAPPVPALEV